MRDTSKDFGKIIIYTNHDELNTILSKVVNADGFTCIDSCIVLQNKFNLSTLYNEHPEYKDVIGSNGREKRLTTSIFEQIDAFSMTKDAEDDVEIMGLIKNVRNKRFIPARYLETHVNTNKYKVVLPKSNGSGSFGETFSSPYVSEPGMGFTQSFISIGAFDSREEAEYALKYLKTKFLRTLLGILKVTQDNNSEVWEFVPLQDFSSTSDIDWSQSISDIDKQLYKKYNLNNEEIAFIENMVIPMDEPSSSSSHLEGNPNG